jgi:hypothetical protein
MREYVAAQLQFMERAAEFTGARVYLDATKSIPRARLLARWTGIKWSVLHLVRDGRGFCVSYIKHARLPQRDLPLAARIWARHIRAVDHVVDSLSLPCLRVRYEDLCQQTEQTLEGVFRFLGVQEPDALEPAHAVHHILGNRMRRTFDGRITEDLAWQTKLTRAEHAALMRIMRPEMCRFGYTRP